MKAVFVLFGLAALTGCGSSSAPMDKPSPVLADRRPLTDAGTATAKPAPSSQPITDPGPIGTDTVIARLNGKPITLGQVEQPLIEGYGLNLLLYIVQYQYVKEQAARDGIVVTEQDVANEREQTLARQFQDADKADWPMLLKRTLEDGHVSEAEFNLGLRTTTYLRKMTEPTVEVTEDGLQQAFRVLYGEKVRVRHIEVGTMQDIVQAKRRLAAGEPFDKVAMEMSRNERTAPLGGELPAFSRSADYPQAFKDAAFNLKEGEVSDAVQANGAYHLIKLEHRIAPTVIKFEDVKESIRADVKERMVQQKIRDMRAQFASEAIRGLKIDLPVLKDQYEARVTQRDQQIHNTNDIREQFQRDRDRILKSATQPTEAASSTSAPEVARPPATRE